jgi:hypothetical protein
VDTDGDGSPDSWNAGMTGKNSTTGLHLDVFPDDPAASIDTDGDGYPDSWNPGKTEKDSTTGLTLDAYPNDPKRHVEEELAGGEPLMSSQMILAIIAVIIVLVLLSVLFMMKPRKPSYSGMDNEKIISNIKEDIIYGKPSMEKEVTGSELRDMYNQNYEVDELSEESTEYIKNLIEESD